MRLSVRSQLGEGKGEAEEDREGGAERRKSAVEMEGKGSAGAADSEVRGQSRTIDGGGDGGGGCSDGGNKEDALAGKVDKERLKAERGRRILNTLDLVETLVSCRRHPHRRRHC